MPTGKRCQRPCRRSQLVAAPSQDGPGACGSLVQHAPWLGSSSRTGSRCVQHFVIEQERKDNVIQTYVKESSLPHVDVEVKNIILDDLRQSPYSARIEFEKVFTNPADHSEIKRERWTASVTYVFRENVKNNELAVNPLGLTIVRFRADQAFS
jgi:hypothetical protein